MRDGGSVYFVKFDSEWNFTHIFTCLCNTQSNGQVERTKPLETLISEDWTDKNDMELNYRNTSIENLKYSPAKLMMSGKLRDLLPIANERLKSHYIDHGSYNNNFKFK
ncbi:hypothetical protein JTB14_033858 [Gonioctena quinquepunctata]|nr:hypothetical protein JTB14_033858 [Gonioctena quinquepunctata]